MSEHDRDVERRKDPLAVFIAEQRRELEQMRSRVALGARLTMLCGIAAILTMVGAFIVWRVQGHRDNGQDANVAALAIQTSHLAKQTARTLDIVVAERARNIRDACKATTERHDHAIRRLNRQVARISQTLPPSARASLEANRKFTVSLINAIVPVENCDAKVQRQTGGSQSGG